MKETKIETIKKVSKIEPENDQEDKHNIKIEVGITVTRVTSRLELLANKYALERDLESLKNSVAEVEGKLKDLDALIAKVDEAIPQ